MSMRTILPRLTRQINPNCFNRRISTRNSIRMASSQPSPNPNSKPQGFKKRAVVSSLIFDFPDGESGKPKVALFRRSDRVSTYRHHLAPISGTIEPTDTDPLTAAWRELREETTLTPTSLSFWRAGKPFTFSDTSINREWTVHPFAFRLKPSEGGQGEKAIATDWEHEGWEWHDPATVVDDNKFGGVPRLHETLRRVWFEGEMDEGAGRALAAGLRRLREDHESGAHELTALALATFREVIVGMRGGIDERWWEVIRMAAWHLVKNGRESMGAATLNALLSVLLDIEAMVLAPQADEERTRDRVLASIDAHLASRKSSTARVKDAFTSYIQSVFLADGSKRDRITMLTLSASSTIRDSILDAFASLDIQTLELRILESRPLFEGANLASSIYTRFRSEFQSNPDKELYIKIYPDASAALAAQDVDVLLLGADRICSPLGVSNKTGSLPAVLSAKHVSPSVKVLVLSELEKVVENGGILEDKLEYNDPMEVISTWRNDGVKGAKVLEETLTRGREDNESSTMEVKNIYLEWVPLTLVDAFVSDEGVLDEKQIEKKSQQLGQLERKFFGDL